MSWISIAAFASAFKMFHFKSAWNAHFISRNPCSSHFQTLRKNSVEILRFASKVDGISFCFEGHVGPQLHLIIGHFSVREKWGSVAMIHDPFRFKKAFSFPRGSYIRSFFIWFHLPSFMPQNYCNALKYFHSFLEKMSPLDERVTNAWKLEHFQN